MTVETKVTPLLVTEAQNLGVHTYVWALIATSAAALCKSETHKLSIVNEGDDLNSGYSVAISSQVVQKLYMTGKAGPASMCKLNLRILEAYDSMPYDISPAMKQLYSELKEAATEGTLFKGKQPSYEWMSSDLVEQVHAPLANAIEKGNGGSGYQNQLTTKELDDSPEILQDHVHTEWAITNVQDEDKLSKGGTIHPDVVVPLAEATQIYQNAKGTSPGSVYKVVAVGKLKVAIRHAANQLSIRVEGDVLNYKTRIISAGFVDNAAHFSKGYASLHLGINNDDKVLARKAVGSILGVLGAAAGNVDISAALGPSK